MTSIGVMEHDDSGRMPERPIVLTLNCKEAARYLSSENPVLTAMLGARIRRVGISLEEYFIYPEQTLGDDTKLAELLMKNYRELSPNELGKRIAAGWLISETRTRLIHALAASGAAYGPSMLATVKIVLIANGSTGDTSSLRLILPAMFPYAAFFRMPADDEGPQSGRRGPTRIWMEPLCPACHREMGHHSSQSFTGYFCLNDDYAQPDDPSVGIICWKCMQRMELVDGRYICRANKLVFLPPNHWGKLDQN